MRDLLSFLRGIEWPIAFFALQVLLMIIGGACIVSFACTLKPFYFAAFVLLSFSGWLLLYLFFAGLSKRRAQ